MKMNDRKYQDLEENRQTQGLSRWSRFNSWFWGPDHQIEDKCTNDLSIDNSFSDISNWLNPDKRLCLGYWITLTIRIILTLIIYANNMHLVVYTIQKGDFMLYQLYFCTWTLYVTSWAETWIIASSVYNRLHDTNTASNRLSKVENSAPPKFQMGIWKHNYIVYILSLTMGTTTFVIYWIKVILFDSRSSVTTTTDIANHSLPVVIGLFEFVAAGWVMQHKHEIVLLPIVTVQIAITGIYALVSNTPLTSILPWNNAGTLIWILILNIVLFIIYALFTTLSICKYKVQVRGVYQTVSLPHKSHNLNDLK